MHDNILTGNSLEGYAKESAKDKSLHLNSVLKVCVADFAHDVNRMTDNRKQTNILTSVVLEDGDTGFVWRLIKRDEGAGEAEEIVFVMNGVICSTDLPPVHRIPK